MHINRDPLGTAYANLVGFEVCLFGLVNGHRAGLPEQRRLLEVAQEQREVVSRRLDSRHDRHVPDFAAQEARFP